MFDDSRNMPLNNPVQRLCEEVENVGRRLYAKDKHTKEKEVTIPAASQKVPVLRADWDMMISILEVQFRKEGSLAKLPEGGDRLLKTFVGDSSLRVRNTIID